MYKAVIFDLNGVILQSQLLSDRFQASFGIPKEKFLPALKDIMKVVRKPNAPSTYSLWEPYLKIWNVKLNHETFLDFWFSGETLTPGILDYLKYLHDSNIKVFIFSNNFKERTEYYRLHFPEIFQNIDKAYFSWETGFVKPSVEAINLLLSENSLAPGDCIFFDDSQENVDLALSLGIHTEKWQNLETAMKSIKIAS